MTHMTTQNVYLQYLSVDEDCFVPGLSPPGYDVAHYLDDNLSQTQCRQKCRETNNCLLAYYIHGAKHCYLKSRVPVSNKEWAVDPSTLIVMFKYCLSGTVWSLLVINCTGQR